MPRIALIGVMLIACILINRKVKAIIMQLSDEDAFILQAAENIKQELSHYSKSMSYHQVLADEKISQRNLAKKLGISKSTFNNLLAFAVIPQELWRAVGDMRNVTIKTACFLKQLLDNQPELIDDCIKLAAEIQKGAGASKIQKLLGKEQTPDVQNVYSITNKLLLKINTQNIIVPIVNIADTNNFIQYIKQYFEHEDTAHTYGQ